MKQKFKKLLSAVSAFAVTITALPITELPAITKEEMAQVKNELTDFSLFEDDLATEEDVNVTREFAVHTANYCMGYLNDGTDVTFKDSDKIYYEDDVVVAVQKGWFTSSSNKFLLSAPYALLLPPFNKHRRNAFILLSSFDSLRQYVSEYIAENSAGFQFFSAK